MVKNIFNTVDNFTANSVFQGKVKKNFNTVYSASKGNCRKFSCLGEHNTQETSPPCTNEQDNYRVCRQRHIQGIVQYKERYCRIEVISELKCM